MSNFTPAWFKKGFFNESLSCDDFLSTHQLLYVNGAFFHPGWPHDRYYAPALRDFRDDA